MHGEREPLVPLGFDLGQSVHTVSSTHSTIYLALVLGNFPGSTFFEPASSLASFLRFSSSSFFLLHSFCLLLHAAHSVHFLIMASFSGMSPSAHGGVCSYLNSNGGFAGPT